MAQRETGRAIIYPEIDILTVEKRTEENNVPQLRGRGAVPELRRSDSPKLGEFGSIFLEVEDPTRVFVKQLWQNGL